MKMLNFAQMLPSLRPRFHLDKNATYLIAGGLGGLGRTIVEWMIHRNARYFVLLSRSGSSKSIETQQWISSMESQGATILAPPCDITNKSALSALLEECARTMPPIKGCIQASMVLKVDTPLF